MKKNIILINTIIFFIILSCNQNDFKYIIIDNGNSIKITDYIGTNKIVQIPSKIKNLPVKEIGDNAFINKQLTNINIPNNIKTIETGAFLNNNIESITIGENVNLELQVYEYEPEFEYEIGIGFKYVFDNDFDYYYNENHKKAGTYTLNNNIWHYNGMPIKENIISNFKNISDNINNNLELNYLINTTWQTITDFGDIQTIVFGENGFKWTGEPFYMERPGLGGAPSSRTGPFPGRNEVGTYRIHGEMVYLSIPEFTYTGILLNGFLNISGPLGAGWEFRRVN